VVILNGSQDQVTIGIRFRPRQWKFRYIYLTPVTMFPGQKSLLEAFHNDHCVEIARYKLLVHNVSAWTLAWSGYLKNPKHNSKVGIITSCNVSNQHIM